MKLRFLNLTVGQHFELDGEIYLKTAPLLARNTHSGAQRMIPRSIMVQVVAEGGAAAPAVPAEPQDLATTLSDHHTHCRALLAPLLERLDESERQSLERELDAAQQALLERLGL